MKIKPFLNAFLKTSSRILDFRKGSQIINVIIEEKNYSAAKHFTGGTTEGTKTLLEMQRVPVSFITTEL